MMIGCKQYVVDKKQAYLSKSLQSAISVPLPLQIKIDSPTWLCLNLFLFIFIKNYGKLMCYLHSSKVWFGKNRRLDRSTSNQEMCWLFPQQKEDICYSIKPGLGFYVWHKMSSVIRNAKRCQITCISTLIMVNHHGRHVIHCRAIWTSRGYYERRHLDDALFGGKTIDIAGTPGSTGSDPTPGGLPTNSCSRVKIIFSQAGV